jgi:hypothetical protein
MLVVDTIPVLLSSHVEFYYTLWYDTATDTRERSAAMADYDSPWKEMLDGYFPAFMAFFFPAAAAEIDWSRGYESLDAELQQIVRDAALGTRLADKLIRVWRRDGSEQFVLIHIEIQGQRDPDFPKRMYVYNYRLFDRYDRPVVSLAVLTDASPTWRPMRYAYNLWGCQVSLVFPVVKVRAYRERWAELEASDNPFATVVMAHLHSQATRRRPGQRLEGKLQLVRRLYERGYARDDVLELFRFLDWVLTLPPALEARFQTAVIELEKERQMPYITSIERMSLERGRQEGRQEGHQEGRQEGEMVMLRRLLTQRFGPLPDGVEQRLHAATVQALERWADRVLDAQHLDDVFRDG